MLSDSTDDVDKINKNLGKPKTGETPAQSLAKSASKKNVKTSEPVVQLKTRKMSSLLPENQKRLKKFNLKNFNLVENKQELRFMGAEMVKMLGAKMDQLKLSTEDKASEVAFFLKSFQSMNVFAHCDTAVFCNVGNTVSDTFRLTKCLINFLRSSSKTSPPETSMLMRIVFAIGSMPMISQKT